MKLTADSRITDTLSKGLILTVTPQARTTVSVAAEQAGSPLTKTNVSTETSFGPYNSDIEYAVNLLSGTAAEVVESKSAFFLVGRQPVLFSFRDFAPPGCAIDLDPEGGGQMIAGILAQAQQDAGVIQPFGLIERPQVIGKAKQYLAIPG